MPENNAHAGQGAVLLDIGDNIGALVVLMPEDLVGAEIEARPVGALAPDHGAHVHFPHAAVINRPADGYGAAPVASLVLAELEEGDYELYERPHGATQLVATVSGGQVTQASWPGQP